MVAQRQPRLSQKAHPADPVRVRPKAFRRPTHWGDAGTEEAPPLPQAVSLAPRVSRLRLAPSQWFGVVLVGSVLVLNLLVHWALSGDIPPAQSGYASGWEEDTPAPAARNHPSPVTVFAAPLAERRTTRYLSIDALDTPSLPSQWQAAPPPTAE